MADDRPTNSFKISPTVLGYVIIAVLAAAGGTGGTAAYFRQQPQLSTVSREEHDRAINDFNKRLDRFEEKLDRLIEQQAAARRR